MHLDFLMLYRSCFFVHIAKKIRDFYAALKVPFSTIFDL